MKTKISLRKLRLILTLLLMLTAFCGLALGSVNISFDRFINALKGMDHTASLILFDLRLPRILAAALAGAGLATAGFLLQTITNNSLCAPNIIGVNAGAGFAVMIILCFFPLHWKWLPLAAFAGALAASFLVLSVTYGSQKRQQKASLVLAGVAVSSIMNAGISFLSLKYPDALTSYAAFSVGGFSGVTINELLLPGLMILLCFLLSMLLASKIQLLCLGDEMAGTLGVNVSRIRILTVILASALCAAVVSFAGLLGFVGLIVPHITRRLSGNVLRPSLPVNALIGMILVIAADLIGRTLFAPGEIPAGIFMALLGAPFFLWLLTKRRSHL